MKEDKTIDVVKVHIKGANSELIRELARLRGRSVRVVVDDIVTEYLQRAKVQRELGATPSADIDEKLS